MSLKHSAKETLNVNNENLLTIETYHVPQEEVVMVVGEPVPKVSPNTNSCYYRCSEARGSVMSKWSFFSVVGYMTYMSILACTSFCAFACVNSAFSILSVNSVASVASVNSVLSIGSVNCFECVFNVPIQAITGHSSNTCNRYSLGDEADEYDKKFLYGLTYRTFQSTVKTPSEEDLVNDCCLFIHSTEAKKHNWKGFIVNSNRTACLVYRDGNVGGDGEGEGTLSQADADAAKYAYEPCPLGAVCT